MPTEPDPRLNIHIYGGSTGETIVLHMPNGDWGVIDCYARSLAVPESNPAYLLLQTNGVRELAFLGLTHPHHDHYRGMSRLLDLCTVKSFWTFKGLKPDDVHLIMDYFAAEAYGDEVERNQLRERSDELSAVFERTDASGVESQDIASLQHLYPLPVPKSAHFAIRGIAPPRKQADEYMETLIRHLKDWDALGPLPDAHHNLISGALLIEYGQTTIVLGGDVEKDAWLGTLKLYEPQLLQSHVVKVSHHGSTNGYCKGLWTTFAHPGVTVAVLTPFRSHSLPDPVAVEHIKGHAVKVHSASVCPPPPPRGGWKLRARAALRTSRRDQPGDPLGCCIVSADSKGNCRVTYEGAAGPL
jgi:hypothetical protein